MAAGKQYRYRAVNNQTSVGSLSEWFNSADLAIDMARAGWREGCSYMLLEADVLAANDPNFNPDLPTTEVQEIFRDEPEDFSK